MKNKKLLLKMDKLKHKQLPHKQRKLQPQPTKNASKRKMLKRVGMEVLHNMRERTRGQNLDHLLKIQVRQARQARQVPQARQDTMDNIDNFKWKQIGQEM